MNLLLDTNVLIDYVGRREPFCKDATSIIAAGYFGDVKLWMAAQSATDVFYVLSKYANSADIQRLLARLYEVVTPVSLTCADLTRATQLLWPDYEDCLISLAANNCQADYIVTRDLRGFDRSCVPVISPANLAVELTQSGITYGSVDF
jgi:predicted nucleic acid-binding protein